MKTISGTHNKQNRLLPSIILALGKQIIKSSRSIPGILPRNYVLSKSNMQAQLRAEADRLGCLSSTDV